MGEDSSRKIWKISDIPMAHASVNDNFLLFDRTELGNSEHIGKKVPIITNLSGKAPNDHDYKSSMSTVGWATITNFDGYTLWADGEVTNPEVGPKLERKDSEGRSEIGGVSMGAQMKRVCSVCGENVDECGHVRGQKYGDRLCTAIAKDTKFDHLALTSHFADKESSLDNSNITPLEIASRIELSTLKITRREVSMGREKAQNIGAAAPMSVEELAARIDAIEARLSETAQEKTEDEKKKEEETSDVSQGIALGPEQSDPVTKGESGLPPPVNTSVDKKDPMITVTPIPPVAEGSQETAPKAADEKMKRTPSDEEKEKAQVLQEVATKYVGLIKTEIAEKTGLSEEELSGRGIKELEAMREVANKTSAKVGEFASYGAPIETGSRVGGMEEANKRIEQFGVQGALQRAFELSTRGGA